MFVYLGECNELVGKQLMKNNALPFTLLQVNNSVWMLEAMLCTVHSTHTSCRITLGKLGVSLVHSMEGRPACVNLISIRSEAIGMTCGIG